MIFPANTIARKLLVTMSLVVAGVVLVLGGFQIVQEYGRYRSEVDALWGQQIEARKKQLETQVGEAVAYIEFKKAQVRDRVQGSLESRVQDAHGVASHLYEIDKGSHSAKELRNLVRETLRKQRFNNGRGYFFIFAMDGTVLLHAAQPELEQKNLLALQDTEGTFVIREMISLARSKGEGFVPYRWPKPGFPPDQEFEKISFIKYLPQLGCFIGAGEYLEDTEAEVKAEALERIEKMRFGSEYVFAGQWDGVALTYPSKGSNMLGVTDVNGVKIVEEAIALARKEGGFLWYVMPKLGEERHSLKLSYVRGVKDWQWYVGSGIYLDDLEAASVGARQQLRREIVTIVGQALLLVLASLLIGLLIVRKMAERIQQAFAAFETFFDKAAREKVEMETSGLHFAEFRSLAKAANQMLAEQRLMEEGVRKSEEKYRILIETTGTGFVKLDGEGRVLDANQEYVRLVGRQNPAEILGRRMSEWTAAHDLARNREALEECANRGFIRHLQVDYVDGRGEFTAVEMNGTRVYNSDGQLEIIAICHDIGGRKRLEEQLRQAQKMEAIGILAGGIAHDFNNILAAIIGYAEMAKRSLPQEAGSAGADIQQVLLAGLRAKDLVKQILAFSRKGGEERSLISPKPIVKEALKFMRASIPASIEIREEIDPDCGAILANPTNIHQIVVNLCTNAFHAMEEAGGVLTVVLKNVEREEGELAGEGDLLPGQYVLFSVRDTGPGMTPEVLARIFDPYFTTKGVGKGSGMGLAVVHGIVKNCGGMVQVESEVGVGTVFHVYLPRIGKGAAVADSIQEWTLPSGQERILYVDDEASIAEMGKAMLSGLGYRVTARIDPLEALEEFRRQPGDFDLLITDQTMPKMSGVQLVQEVRKIRPDLPVILCTGYSAAIGEDSAMGMGIRHFIMKPLTMRMLAEKVRKALEGKG